MVGLDRLRLYAVLPPSLDKEAMRIVSVMPKWIPGKQDGRPVAVYYTLPIKFKLSK